MSLTVAKLIQALDELPSNASIRELSHASAGLITSVDDLGLFVYEQDGTTELHFDTGQAYHPRYQCQRERLSEYVKRMLEQ